MMEHVDIFIVGGGMVGTAIAARLGGSGLRIAVLEQSAPAAFDPASAPDLRVSAISPASIKLLQDIGAWQHITAMRSAPYLRMQVWEQKRADGTLFDASEIGAANLGHIVENRIVQLGCTAALAAHDNIELICPDEISQLQIGDGIIQITLQSGRCFTARLLIGADGARSRVREAAAIGLNSHEYPMHAFVATVGIRGGERDITWQRFTPHGPQSLLPLPGDYASLVWYQTAAKVRELMQLDDNALITAFRAEFPDVLPDLSHIISRGSFPLIRRHAQTYIRPGVALAGDAAHTIHPLAGQGVNLGFQDVAALCDVILAAQQQGNEIGALEVLQRYQQRRQLANHAMQRLMDLFCYGFSNDIGPLRFARNLGLKLANRSGPLKKEVIRYALGLQTPEQLFVPALHLFPAR
ncbi:FAD-dependent monooxygenase [Vogesella oryzae]|uniref:FAD-dependent monooxygenase n=1 Tax=Vogesella oryzae TaxID=1735285 RepID=UPI001583DB6B|nr:FAD-dependent monooxygenase [Vogesella oryzae]